MGAKLHLLKKQLESRRERSAPPLTAERPDPTLMSGPSLLQPPRTAGPTATAVFPSGGGMDPFAFEFPDPDAPPVARRRPLQVRGRERVWALRTELLFSSFRFPAKLRCPSRACCAERLRPAQVSLATHRRRQRLEAEAATTAAPAEASESASPPSREGRLFAAGGLPTPTSFAKHRSMFSEDRPAAPSEDKAQRSRRQTSKPIQPPPAISADVDVELLTACDAPEATLRSCLQVRRPQRLLLCFSSQRWGFPLLDLLLLTAAAGGGQALTTAATAKPKELDWEAQGGGILGARRLTAHHAETLVPQVG